MNSDLEPWRKLSTPKLIVSTTPFVEGRTVEGYLGIVAGEAIIGANIFKDVFAAVRDIVGGRSASYERALADACKIAIAEMEKQASGAGANAVVGVDLDHEVINNMLMVSASGTAVRLG